MSWQIKETLRSQPRRLRVGWRWTAFAAAGAALVLFALWSANRPGAPTVAKTIVAPAPQPVEIFSVATASEVTILHVEGADTHTLVVGVLPVSGALELAAPGDIVVTSIEPAARDNMRPVVLQGTLRPMIWAKVEAEEDEQ